MKKLDKQIVKAAFIGIALMGIGTLKGAADFHDIAPGSYSTMINGAITSANPLPYKLRANVRITAYSSRVEETKPGDPFTTASGIRVHDGTVAANWLPFGTKVRIPKLFGNKVFTVEDRMAKKNSEKMDIWFASTNQALRFGVNTANVEIL